MYVGKAKTVDEMHCIDAEKFELPFLSARLDPREAERERVVMEGFPESSESGANGCRTYVEETGPFAGVRMDARADVELWTLVLEVGMLKAELELRDKNLVAELLLVGSKLDRNCPEKFHIVKINNYVI